MTVWWWLRTKLRWLPEKILWEPAFLILLFGTLWHHNALWLSTLAVYLVMDYCTMRRGVRDLSLASIDRALLAYMNPEDIKSFREISWFTLRSVFLPGDFRHLGKKRNSIARPIAIAEIGETVVVIAAENGPPPVRVLIHPCKKIRITPIAFAIPEATSIVMIPGNSHLTINLRFLLLHELEHVNERGVTNYAAHYTFTYSSLIATLVLFGLATSWWHGVVIGLLSLFSYINSNRTKQIDREVLADHWALHRIVESGEYTPEQIRLLIDDMIEIIGYRLSSSHSKLDIAEVQARVEHFKEWKGRKLTPGSRDAPLKYSPLVFAFPLIVNVLIGCVFCYIATNPDFIFNFAFGTSLAIILTSIWDAVKMWPPLINRRECLQAIFDSIHKARRKESDGALAGPVSEATKGDGGENAEQDSIGRSSAPLGPTPTNPVQ